MNKPRPLASSECGRGVVLPPERLEELERYCAHALCNGVSQDEIASHLGITRSRVSRWSIAGIRKYGSDTDHRLLNTRDRSITQMMWARIDVRRPDECWPWRGAIKSNGYGALNYKGKGYNAHRLVYETLVAAVPEALVIDHKCRNRACCNPAHLHIVTQHVNILLGLARRVAA